MRNQCDNQRFNKIGVLLSFCVDACETNILDQLVYKDVNLFVSIVWFIEAKQQTFIVCFERAQSHCYLPDTFSVDLNLLIRFTCSVVCLASLLLRICEGSSRMGTSKVSYSIVFLVLLAIAIFRYFPILVMAYAIELIFLSGKNRNRTIMEYIWL